jgi:UDP-N-acetylmuramate dehydrogenase
MVTGAPAATGRGGAVTSEAMTEKLQREMPDLRGKLAADRSLAEITWFRVGGPAEVLFTPADEADLSYFLKNNQFRVPVTIIGLGSNLLVRDGGVPGVVIRLGRGFGQIKIEDNHSIRVGAMVPDVKVARAAGEAGIAGLSFYRGIPGSVGGALRMNAGAHGGETKDVLVEARAVAPDGTVHVLSRDDMQFTYRHCGIPDDWIFTEALFQGTPGTPEDIAVEMQDVAKYREENQPIKERTGGSTFKNPDGHSAWKLVDAAGMRGHRVGGARVSDMHCNFLINDQGATGEDLERLGETVRARVKAAVDVELQWEIKRIGVPLQGRASGEALVEDTTSGAPASTAEQ